MTSITQGSTRLVAFVAGVAVAATLLVGAFAAAPAQAASLTQSQISSIISLLQSFGADAATIANVQASLNGQPTSGTGGSTSGGSSAACPALSRDIQTGSVGADVMALQKFLNSNAATMVAASGAGSPGNETSTFGPATTAAVKKFQTMKGITPVAGYVGAKTRAAIAAACGGSTSGGTTVPTGPGLSVSAGAQPANALAPASATRVPFTTFTLANNTGTVQTVTGVTVQRTGVGVDTNFSGIVLVDATNNIQLGTAKTLNSNHQATVGDTFSINPGQSLTLTVAGNIANSSTAQAGQIVSLQIVAVNSSAPIAGTLPIMGASHTINTTLTLGSVSTTTSGVIPPTGSSQSKNFGDTAVKFSGVRFTAGSAEDLKLYSIRWRQVGTVSASDIANITTYVNGTAYPTVLSLDGKYYTSSFSGGILIPKGNSIDVYVQGDLVGSNSASRTVDFDIDKVTDVYFVGQNYGYGVAPSGTYQPWYSGDSFTINAGSATTISKATEVAASNIASNVPNQPLGGFVTDFRGEAVSVTSLPVTFATSSDMGGPITSISLVNENGAVVAGPLDEAASATTGSGVTFTDTITFPTGRHVYTIKGKIPSGATNGTTVVASTIPANWGGVTGSNSGNSVTLSGFGTVTMNTMTVQAAALKIALSTSPSSQNVVGGGQGVLLANLLLDAQQSGEDIRLSSVPIIITVTTMTVSELTSCQIFDGATALNTGSNVPSALATSGSATTYTFDNSLTIAKGTVKTLSLKCNIAASVSDADYLVTTISTSAANWSSTGVTSGSAITETFGNSTGGTMTIGSGSMTVTVDSSSPAFSLVAAGSTGVTMSVVKVHATNEDLNLKKLGLVLTGSGNALSQAKSGGGSTNGGISDLAQVYIYDGATLVGTATFTDTSVYTATSTLSSTVNIPKDSDKLLTIKADLASIGVSGNGGVGDVVKVDPQSAEASGGASGSTIRSGATAGAAGVQMFKSFPTVSNEGVSCTNSNACNGTQQVLKKFKVTANSAGPISLYQVAATLATSSATVTNLKLFAYTNGYDSGPANISGTTNGQFGGTAPLAGAQDTAAPTVSFIQTTPYSFTGTTYFVLKGDVAVSGTSWNVNATIQGDSASTTSMGGRNTNVAVSVGRTQNTVMTGLATTTSNHDFVWSDNASTTPTISDVDWINGYYVPGLSSSGF